MQRSYHTLYINNNVVQGVGVLLDSLIDRRTVPCTLLSSRSMQDITVPLSASLNPLIVILDVLTLPDVSLVVILELALAAASPVSVTMVTSPLVLFILQTAATLTLQVKVCSMSQSKDRVPPPGDSVPEA